MAIFWIRFFRSHSKRWDLVFIDFSFFGLFFNFWPFFLSIGFLALFFIVFFTLFLKSCFLNGSCRMWHQSGDFFFAKNPKKSKKVEKMTFFGVQKKGSKLDLFVP